MENGSVQSPVPTQLEDKAKNIFVAYSNGFEINVQAADVQLILKLGTEPVGVVLLPLPVLKSLVDGGQQVITAYEEATGSEIKKLAELQGLINVWAASRREGA